MSVHTVLVLNPNCTATMTANVVQQLQPLMGPGFDVQPLTAGFPELED